MKTLMLIAAGATALLACAASAQVYGPYRFADAVDYDALISLREFRGRVVGYAQAGRCPYAKQLARELRDNDVDTRLRAICDGPPVRLWD